MTEHTPGPKLCPKCGERQPDTQDWFGEAVRQKSLNADLLAALKVATDKIEAWRDGALVTRNWAVGTSIPDMEKLIASYNAIIDPARAAIERAEVDYLYHILNLLDGKGYRTVARAERQAIRDRLDAAVEKANEA